MVEHRSPKPSAQGSSPCTPAKNPRNESCEDFTFSLLLIHCFILSQTWLKHWVSAFFQKRKSLLKILVVSAILFEKELFLVFDLPQNTTRQNASFEHQFPVCCRLMPIFTSVTASKKHHQNRLFLNGYYGFSFLFSIIVCYFRSAFGVIVS